ncbi:MAG: flavodoxin family protein [Blastococcus sp.]
MRAVVVFESMFGNTAEIARAVAEGIREARPDAVVDCLPVHDARGAEVDLLVVGGPTHFLGLASGRTRHMAEKFDEAAEAEGRTVQPAENEGLREWLEQLPQAPVGRRAAAFDTRLDKLLHGSAAARIAHRLARKGYDLVSEPEGFVVVDMTGPPRSGELERAKAWGACLLPASSPARS